MSRQSQIPRRAKDIFSRQNRRSKIHYAPSGGGRTDRFDCALLAKCCSPRRKAEGVIWRVMNLGRSHHNAQISAIREAIQRSREDVSLLNGLLKRHIFRWLLFTHPTS
jgi:hypothetical protein